MSKRSDATSTSPAPAAAERAPADAAASGTPAQTGPGGEGAPAVAEVQAAPPAEAAPDYASLYEQANDRWLRARAELDNYRKRVQREFAELRTQAVLQTVAEFLTIYDQLEMALAHAASAAQADSLRRGIELTHAEFGRVLQRLGVTRIETTGKPFDPACEEAVAQEPSEEVPAGIVLREWKAGFLLGDRLLRPAVVLVSSGPPPSRAAGPAEREPEAGGCT